MNPEVSKGNTNHLTATALKAVDVEEEATLAATPTVSDYVQLQVKDKKIDGEDAFVVVDTAYYEATEAPTMLKFGYDKLGADKRAEGSYQFKFTYNAQKNELYAQVKKVVYKLTANSGKATEYAKDIKEVMITLGGL